MAVIETVPGPGRPGPLRRLVGWWGDRPWLQLAIVAAVVALFWLLGANIAGFRRVADAMIDQGVF